MATSYYSDGCHQLLVKILGPIFCMLGCHLKEDGPPEAPQAARHHWQPARHRPTATAGGGCEGTSRGAGGRPGTRRQVATAGHVKLTEMVGCKKVNVEKMINTCKK